MMKGKHVIIPKVFNKQALDQLHLNNIGIGKTKFLAWELIFWININDDTEKHIKNCTTCPTFQQTQDKIIHHNIPAKPWEMVGTYMFTLNNKHYPCIVQYHSKFPVIKK